MGLYENGEFHGMYRGIVVSNDDPLTKGRLKIFVPGVYPEEYRESFENLPWSEPAMPLSGGSWLNENQEQGDEYENHLNKETGCTTIPHASKKNIGDGAQVWLFFERGDWNFPVHIAAAQSGPGWLSEHNNQHVTHTDNVRIRVDERPTDEKSTTKFDTYNKKCTNLSQTRAEKKVPTRVDIEIWNQLDQAVHLHIKGDLNLHVEGDYYEEIIGDRHITHHGNTYFKRIGDTQNEYTGVIHEIHNGNYSQERVGNADILFKGDVTQIIDGNNTQSILNTHKLTVIGSSIQNFHNSEDALTINANGIKMTSYGDMTQYTCGTSTYHSKLDFKIQAGINNGIYPQAPPYGFLENIDDVDQQINRNYTTSKVLIAASDNLEMQAGRDSVLAAINDIYQSAGHNTYQNTINELLEITGVVKNVNVYGAQNEFIATNNIITIGGNEVKAAPNMTMTGNVNITGGDFSANCDNIDFTAYSLSNSIEWSKHGL